MGIFSLFSPRPRRAARCHANNPHRPCLPAAAAPRPAPAVQSSAGRPSPPPGTASGRAAASPPPPGSREPRQAPRPPGTAPGPVRPPAAAASLFPLLPAASAAQRPRRPRREAAAFPPSAGGAPCGRAAILERALRGRWAPLSLFLVVGHRGESAVPRCWAEGRPQSSEGLGAGVVAIAPWRLRGPTVVTTSGKMTPTSLPEVGPAGQKFSQTVPVPWNALGVLLIACRCQILLRSPALFIALFFYYFFFKLSRCTQDRTVEISKLGWTLLCAALSRALAWGLACDHKSQQGTAPILSTILSVMFGRIRRLHLTLFHPVDL